ncbi:MAG: YciK family oxidoreductase [Magnetococcales bacterium]|nr:YciK family oxidoreductase [Magnetococcales bacterium]HIJ82744.1 SDR family NAD(P)-dependent oxidoreductase [Magnetococcales bacterium]
MLLKDKITLVTGAGSGIGRAVANLFASEGAWVILLGRTQAKLEETSDQINAAGGRAVIAPLDLENGLDRIPELARALHERFGHLDVLVNNAGILGTLTPLENYESILWEQVFRINVTAPFFLTRELMPLLKKSPEASVINCSSSVAFKGRAFWGAYAATKAALVNMTETWAGEFSKRGVRFNTVNPGATATAMRAQAYPGEDPATLPAPQQVARVFLYLASHFSTDVRGQHLNARDWLTWHLQ